MSLGGIRTYVGHARVRLINSLELEPRCRASLFYTMDIIVHQVRQSETVKRQQTILRDSSSLQNEESEEIHAFSYRAKK